MCGWTCRHVRKAEYFIYDNSKTVPVCLCLDSKNVQNCDWIRGPRTAPHFDACTMPDYVMYSES